MHKNKAKWCQIHHSEPFGITHHGVIPSIKLSEPATFWPEEITGHDISVIRIQDLVSRDGTRTNSCFEAIVNAGGLQGFFGNAGIYILSSIAPDRVIAGLNPALFLEILEKIGAKWYITPDGATYCRDERDIRTGERELERILETTDCLLESTDAQPIGLIKGSTIEQVRFHAQQLRELDLPAYAFHTSDFLLHNNRLALSIGSKMFSEARALVPYLMAYGIGARSSMRHFQSADLFVTQSHFAQAFRHYCYRNGRAFHLADHIPIDRQTIMGSLKDICGSALSFGRGRSTLNQWTYQNVSVYQSTICDFCPQRQQCAVSLGVI